jgi:hypothetical protein
VVDAGARDREGLDQAERVRVAEVEATQALGDDDRVAAVGREVEVVRVDDRDRPARSACARVDRSRVAGVVVDVQSPRSYAGVTCCGSAPTEKCSTRRKVRGSMTSTEFASLFGT